MAAVAWNSAVGALTAAIDRSTSPVTVIVRQDAGHGSHVASIMRAVHQDIAWQGRLRAWVFPYLPASVYALEEAATLLGLHLHMEPDLERVRQAVKSETEREAAVRKLLQAYIDDRKLPTAAYTSQTIPSPYWHQRLAYHWFKRTHVLYLMHKMGTGKTRAGSDIIRGKYEDGVITDPEQFWVGEEPSVIDNTRILPGQWCVRGGALICCPSAVAQEWTQQLWKWQGMEPLHISGAGAEDKRKKAGIPALVHVCSYDSLEAVERNVYNLIIADEAHFIANQDSNRFKRLLHLRRKAKAALALSGTPQSNGLESYWAQFFFLDGGRTLGPTMQAYKRTFLNAKDRTDGLTPDQAVSRAISRIAWPLTMLEAFPDKAHKINKVIHVPMTPEQADYYEKIRSQQEADVLTGKVNLVESMARLAKLQQVTQGFVLDDNKVVQQFSSAKLTALETLLKKGGDLEGKRTIVWCAFKAEMPMLEGLMKRIGIKYMLLHSGMTQAERARAKDTWNTDASYRVLLGGIALGIGLNLHAPDCVDEDGQPARCSTTVFYNLTWKVTVVEQAMDRVYRSDQKETCLYVYLLSQDLYTGSNRKPVKPMDVKIYELLMLKLESAKDINEQSITYVRGLLAA